MHCLLKLKKFRRFPNSKYPSLTCICFRSLLKQNISEVRLRGRRTDRMPPQRVDNVSYEDRLSRKCRSDRAGDPNEGETRRTTRNAVIYTTKSGGHLGWRQNLSLKSLRLIRCAFYRTLLRRKHLRRSARRWLAISFSQTTSGAPLWSAQCLVLLSSLWRHTAPRSLNCVPLKEGPVDTRCALFYTAITWLDLMAWRIISLLRFHATERTVYR